jgi:hypothetical protein
MSRLTATITRDLPLRPTGFRVIVKRAGEFISNRTFGTLEAAEDYIAEAGLAHATTVRI